MTQPKTQAALAYSTYIQHNIRFLIPSIIDRGLFFSATRSFLASAELKKFVVTTREPTERSQPMFLHPACVSVVE